MLKKTLVFPLKLVKKSLVVKRKLVKEKYSHELKKSRAGWKKFGLIEIKKREGKTNMEVISIYEKQTQEASNREIFRQVADFVGQAQLATHRMGSALDEMEQPAGEVISVGLNALESADDANNALWKAREELAILQFLFTMTEDSIDRFQLAFFSIRSLQETVSEFKTAVRNIMTSPGQAESYLAMARRKVKLTKIELPGILAATDDIEF